MVPAMIAPGRNAPPQMELPFPSPGPASPAELRLRVIRLTAELVHRARERWPDVSFPDPEILFRLRGRSAGEACPRTNATNYNRELLERYGDDFIRQIVPHEVAHLIAPRIAKGRIKPHGREWKEVMAFFGAPARASHEFEAPPVPERGRHRYRCACPDPHWLTTRSHRRVRRGTMEYTCRRCREVLVWTG